MNESEVSPLQAIFGDIPVPNCPFPSWASSTPPQATSPSTSEVQDDLNVNLFLDGHFDFDLLPKPDADMFSMPSPMSTAIEHPSESQISPPTILDEAQSYYNMLIPPDNAHNTASPHAVSPFLLQASPDNTVPVLQESRPLPTFQTTSSECTNPISLETKDFFSPLSETRGSGKRKAPINSPPVAKKRRVRGGERGRSRPQNNLAGLTEEELRKIRRVKNRESVEKCRAKQRLRLEALQVEQSCLRSENEAMRGLCDMIRANSTELASQFGMATTGSPLNASFVETGTTTNTATQNMAPESGS